MKTTDLTNAVRGQLHHMAASVDGLTDEQLTTSLLPSGWTPVGMILHARENVRWWATQIMLDTPRTDDLPDGQAFVVPAEQARAVIDTFLADSEADLQRVDDLPLDTAPAWWPHDIWGNWQHTSLSQVLIHLLREISTHAGHLDVGRELIDGGTFNWGTNEIELPV